MNRPQRPDPERFDPERPEHPYADEDLRPVLARAVADLRFAEPGMPDLLGPAMAEGTRLRRRRRTNILVALSASAALVLGGVVGGVAYLGGDTDAGPASAPGRTVGTASGGSLTPVEALAAALERHLRPHGVVIDPKPWTVRPESAGPLTKIVSITLRDRDGRAGALVMSGGLMSGAMPNATEVDNSCAALLQGDTDAGFDDKDKPACKKRPLAEDGSQIWSYYLRPIEEAGKSGRAGAVRLGPDDEVFRAMMWEPPTGASESETLVLDEAVMAAVVADPAVARAMERVPMPSQGAPVTPPPAWSVDDVATSEPPTAGTTGPSST
ncbi:hypothetical protein [Yinghuangia sp. YIM S09857]|uniref:hypothetical protein n=1 Tax=Yinghuangia sp. YIM S09857 TaxID=3436929 RepID=UPI003F53C604